MKESNFILQWTEDIKTEINGLPFDSDDIRKDYFGLLYDIAYSYYRGYILLDFADFINKGKILFDQSIYSYKTHVDRVAETPKHPVLTAGYFNSLNRNLLIGAWSNFELCVTTLCAAISDNNELEKMLTFQFRDTVKQLKNSDIDPRDLEKLKKLTIKEHLTHVPINRKSDFLFKKAKHYSRDLSEDKEFLKFMGKFRNTIHTNFIYYGKDYEYRFGQAHFVFKDKKIVKWADPFKGTPRLFFHLMTFLKEIWKEIILTIDHKEIILYPDNEQT